MLIGRRLNEYQTTVVARERAGTNTRRLCRFARILAHVLLPLMWVLCARSRFIVKRSLKVLALAFGLFGTFVFILDGLYIGLFASPEVLVNYPWGTELGWAYESK